MNDYVVYCHIFPNKKRYIGITRQKPTKRWNNGYGYIGSPLMYNAIQKYKWHNIEHRILYTNLKKHEAEQKEIELIKEYNSNNIKNGYNIANGGSAAGVYTIETRNKISKSHLGKKLSNETKMKIGIANSGEKHYLFGKTISNEAKLHLSLINMKPVSQFTKNNIFIRNFNSIQEAEKELKISNSNISQCCMNKRKSAGGYVWKYSKEGMTY